MRWIILLLATAARVAGDDWFVGPAGNDNHDGSQAQPFREIRRALAAVHPGDTIAVADGDYLGFTIENMAGTDANPITIKAAGTNAVIRATTDRPDNRDNIFITRSQYLVLDGLIITNAPRAGLRIDHSPHITVRNGRFGNNYVWGIFTDFSNDTLLQNNECYGSKTQHGIYISNSSDRPILRDNRVHDNGACGIHMNGDRSQGGDGIISGALVERNIIANNGSRGGAAINMDGVQDSIVRNNLLTGNHASGITAFCGDGAAGPKNVQLLHNTIDMAGDARWAILIGESTGKITVRNNLLSNVNPRRGGLLFRTRADAGNADSDYNAFSGNCYVSTDDGNRRIALNHWQTDGHEPHSICSELKNLIIGPGDYHLQPDAPAVDAGITITGVGTDMDRNPRAAGKASDIGCYEFTPKR